MNSVKSFLRLIVRVIGPNKNFDLGLFFFLIIIPAFALNLTNLASKLETLWLTLISQLLPMSPFKLYLYLKPLYSIRGGSTTRAEPFTKKPRVVFFLWKPLYKWNIFNHLMLVLSFIKSQVDFCNINTNNIFLQYKKLSDQRVI